MPDFTEAYGPSRMAMSSHSIMEIFVWERWKTRLRITDVTDIPPSINSDGIRILLAFREYAPKNIKPFN